MDRSSSAGANRSSSSKGSILPNFASNDSPSTSTPSDTNSGYVNHALPTSESASSEPSALETHGNLSASLKDSDYDWLSDDGVPIEPVLSNPPSRSHSLIPSADLPQLPSESIDNLDDISQDDRDSSVDSEATSERESEESDSVSLDLEGDVPAISPLAASKRRQRTESADTTADSEDEVGQEVALNSAGVKVRAESSHHPVSVVSDFFPPSMFKKSITSIAGLKQQAEDEDEEVPVFVRSKTSVAPRSHLFGVSSMNRMAAVSSTEQEEAKEASDNETVDFVRMWRESLAASTGVNVGGKVGVLNARGAPVKKAVGRSESRLIRRVAYMHSGAWIVLDRMNSVFELLNRSDVMKHEDEDEVVWQVDPNQIACLMEVRHGDLTGENVDIIVNAANSYLSHGGGVAGAISSKGGASIQNESDFWVRAHGPVDTGHIGLTAAGRLKCKWVIHAVGPMYDATEAERQEQELFACVFKSLQAADSQSMKCQSIAIPAISSGIFGFPKQEVARIIFSAAIAFITNTGRDPLLDTTDRRRIGSEERRGGDKKEVMQREGSEKTEPNQRHPKHLKLIRFTNFDMPTVNLFQSRFDLLFQTERREEEEDGDTNIE